MAPNKLVSATRTATKSNTQSKMFKLRAVATSSSKWLLNNHQYHLPSSPFPLTLLQQHRFFNNIHNNKVPSPKLTNTNNNNTPPTSTTNHTTPTSATSTATSTTKKKTKSSKEWLRRQLKDTYVKSRNSSSTEHSKGIKYRSRAGYKLQQLDEKLKFMSQSSVVIDLGAAPGAWSQYAAKFMKRGGVLLSLDLLPMSPLVRSEELGQLSRHVTLQGDFTSEDTWDRIHDALLNKNNNENGQNGQNFENSKFLVSSSSPSATTTTTTTGVVTIAADTILSDMAPNTTGNQSLDHGRIMQLCHSVVDFVEGSQVLKPGGTLLMKYFAGPEEIELRNRLKALFSVVTSVKPDASRQDSSEMYIYARNYLPRRSVAKGEDEGASAGAGGGGEMDVDALDPRIAVSKLVNKKVKRVVKPSSSPKK